MKSRIVSLGLLGLTLAGLSGCIIERRIAWSPDGRRGLIRTHGERWILVEEPDLEGRMLDVVAYGTSWLPDGRRFVATEIIYATAWKDLEPYVTPEEREQLIQLSESVFPRMLALADKTEEPSLENALPEYNHRLFAAAMLYGIANASPAERQKVLNRLGDEEAMAAVVNLLTLDGEQVTRKRLTSIVTNKRAFPFVDPTGRTLALLIEEPFDSKDSTGEPFNWEDFQTGDDSPPIFALGLLDLEKPGLLRVLDHGVGIDVAWHPSGRQLAYFKGNPSQGDNLTLGKLVTREVLYSASDTLAEAQPGYQQEVGVINQLLADLEYDPQGRLYFATLEIHLPATEGDMPSNWSVFRLDPQQPAVVQRVFTRQAVADFAGQMDGPYYFDLSPDGQRLLLLGSETFLIYDLVRGLSVWPIENVETGERGVAPVWKSDTEFAVLVQREDERGSKDRNELLLIETKEKSGSIKQTQCLSRNWPDEWVENWFEIKQEDKD